MTIRPMAMATATVVPVPTAAAIRPTGARRAAAIGAAIQAGDDQEAILTSVAMSNANMSNGAMVGPLTTTRIIELGRGLTHGAMAE